VKTTSILLCLLLTGIIGLGLGFALAPDLPSAPMMAEAPGERWTRSIDRASPEGELVVGFWIDGGHPVVSPAIEIGGSYYEYNAGNPRGPVAKLYSFPPVWWISMPGGAR
jgi:hypothetical protein